MLCNCLLLLLRLWDYCHKRDAEEYYKIWSWHSTLFYLNFYTDNFRGKGGYNIMLYFSVYNTQTFFGPFLQAPAGEVMSPGCQTRHNATGYLGGLVPKFADAMVYSFNFWLWRTFFVIKTRRISHGWIIKAKDVTTYVMKYYFFLIKINLYNNNNTNNNNCILSKVRL